MKTELLNEEVNRIRLMFGYDSKKTLTENQETISETVISEQAQFLKNLFKSDVKLMRAAATELKAEMGALKGGVSTVDGVILRDADDIMKAVKAGKLAPAELGRVNAQLLRATKNPAVEKALIQDIVTTPAFGRKYGKMSKAEVKQALMKKDPTLWTNQRVNAALKEYEMNVAKFGTAGKVVPKKTPVAKRKPVAKKKPAPLQGKETNWVVFKEKIKGMSRSRAVRLLLAAGGLYLVWSWLTSDGTTPYPPCLTNNLGEEDVKKMADECLNELVIVNTGDKTIDSNGGGKFYDDGKFETGNGRYSGSWKLDGDQIIMSVGGNDYSMACGTENATDDNGGTGGTGGGSRYTKCDSFPIKKYCRGGRVIDIQECIGASPDGKYGDETERKLKEKGYPTEITQEVYDKIMKNCGKSSTDTNPSGFDTDIYTSSDV